VRGPDVLHARMSPVHILFLDESGRPGDRTFAVGGVAIAGDRWGELRARWEAALEAHRWPLDREAKWHGIRTGEVPPPLADALFAAVAGADITCFVVVLRPLAGRKSHPELFATDEDTYATALTFLAERFQRFLADRDSHGVMVVDSRRPDVDDRTRRFFERLQREGTPYQRLERIIDALFLGPSHYSIGLQAADLVVASTLAASGGQLGDASRWHKQLRPRFARHPATGHIDGVGFKVFPGRVKGEEEPPSKLFTA
jgi:uncharacterized protein DUF3800